MSETSTGERQSQASLAAMEGRGAYNRHARLQADGVGMALPLLEQAARAVQPPAGEGPLLIADYGSSQGRNSLRPMGAAITVLRERAPERPICVSHTDLPGNDFGALFQTLLADPDRYLRNQLNVFASAVGRSFFEPLLPPAQVVLGWSSFAAHWLSRSPASIPGHFHELLAADDVREAFKAQAAADWRLFLSLRARELCPTGRLVILLPTVGDDGRQGYEPLLDAANDTLAELVEHGELSAAERARMVIPDRIRSRAELLAPFAETGTFAGLAVDCCEVARGPDSMWDAFVRDGDARTLAEQRARLFRATFVPTLATALDPARSPADRLAFMDALEARLTRRLENRPFQVLQTLVMMVVTRLPQQAAADKGRQEAGHAVRSGG